MKGSICLSFLHKLGILFARHSLSRMLRLVLRLRTLHNSLVIRTVFCNQYSFLHCKEQFDKIIHIYYSFVICTHFITSSTFPIIKNDCAKLFCHCSNNSMIERIFKSFVNSIFRSVCPFTFIFIILCELPQVDHIVYR